MYETGVDAAGKTVGGLSRRTGTRGSGGGGEGSDDGGGAGTAEVPDAADQVAELTTDEVPRVRRAACTSLAAVGEAEHADALRTATDDADPAVRDAAARALDWLARRLDRPL